jgi:hypothetical protein
MGLTSLREPRRSGATSDTAARISAWSMEGADANTTDLIAAWSMEGALRSLDPTFGAAVDAPAIATAEHARVCGTAYEVPVLVKSPEDDDWVPLAGAAVDADGDPSEIARRLIGY